MSEDNAKTMEMLNQMIITQYLKQIGSSKVKKVLLHPVFPNTPYPNMAEPFPFILIEDTKVWPPNLGKILN